VNEVGGQINEERSGAVLLDERQRRVREDVHAVALADLVDAVAVLLATRPPVPGQWVWQNSPRSWSTRST
jgi:hypothetical protein